MSKQRGISRRRVLGAASAAVGTSLIADPRVLFLENMVDGLIQKAMAQAGGYNPRRYIYVQQPGAPPRWMFDLFLTPYSTTGFVSNPMVGTRYVASGGRYTAIQYATVSRNGINVPHMWQFDVPRAGGGTRPMTDLLRYLLAVQGINTANAGHPGSRLLHFKPTGALRSLPALNADFSPTPIPAVNLNAQNYNFSSLAGKTAARVTGGGNLLQSLLSPFIGTASATFTANLSRVNSVMEAGIAALDEFSASQHPAARALASDRVGAERLLRQGFPNLATQWTTLLNKYNDLIRRAIDPTQRLAGINDLPIGVTTARGGEYELNGTLVSTADVRDLITSTTTIGNMAAHFAVAEYLLVNDLSRSITLSMAPMTNLNRTGNAQASSTFDEHNTGRMISLYINTMYSRALASCLLELVDRLGTAGIFNDTVIDVGGEFNRSPRNDATGSDHGFQGASVALYSGAFNGPLVIGNLRSNVSTGYPGTWGYGAGIPQLSNAQLGLNHLAATVAAALRAPSPVSSAGSLVQFSGTTMTPIIERTRIV